MELIEAKNKLIDRFIDIKNIGNEDIYNFYISNMKLECNKSQEITCDNILSIVRDRPEYICNSCDKFIKALSNNPKLLYIIKTFIRLETFLYIERVKEIMRHRNDNIIDRKTLISIVNNIKKMYYHIIRLCSKKVLNNIKSNDNDIQHLVYNSKIFLRNTTI